MKKKSVDSVNPLYYEKKFFNTTNLVNNLKELILTVKNPVIRDKAPLSTCFVFQRITRFFTAKIFHQF